VEIETTQMDSSVTGKMQTVTDYREFLSDR
jgi:hypothetical protein